MRILFLTVWLGATCISANAMAQEDAKQEQKSPELPYRISKETTRITRPLTKDGRVDYAAYLNQQLSRGVTPKNNAAVLYWQAIGDRKRETYGDEYYENLVKLLGTNPFEHGEPYLVGLDEFIERKQKAGLENAEEVIKAKLEEAQSAPWIQEASPLMAEWLKLNAKPLKLVLAGTQRSHYFRPLAKANRFEDLLTLLSSDELGYRDFCRLLRIRATLGLGEKRPEGAIRDLLALHRLADHTATGPADAGSLTERRGERR